MVDYVLIVIVDAMFLLPNYNLTNSYMYLYFMCNDAYLARLYVYLQAVLTIMAAIVLVALLTIEVVLSTIVDIYIIR